MAKPSSEYERLLESAREAETIRCSIADHAFSIHETAIRAREAVADSHALLARVAALLTR